MLFALAEYQSAAVAGIVTFASLFPGIVLSPLAGALLDRHGRVRLIGLDYLVAMTTMLLVGGLAIAGLLTETLLVIIAAVSSVTGPLSQTGLRSLFPLMTPRHLWERVNALDSSGYVVATIIGPPAAALLVALAGPRLAVMAIGIPYLIAAIAIVGVREPASAPSSSGRLLRDAWAGLRYVWGNRSLRGLGFSISTLNISGGMTTIVVPLIVLQHLGGSAGGGGPRVRPVGGRRGRLGGPRGSHRLSATRMAAAGATDDPDGTRDPAAARGRRGGRGPAGLSRASRPAW